MGGGCQTISLGQREEEDIPSGAGAVTLWGNMAREHSLELYF